MCPLWPLHLLVMYALLLWPVLMVSCGVAAQVAERFSSPEVSAEAIARSVLRSQRAAVSDQTDQQRFNVQFSLDEDPMYDAVAKGVEIHIDEKKIIRFQTDDLTDSDRLYGQVYVEVDDQDVTDAETKTYQLSVSNRSPSWNNSFSLSGVFLGKTFVRLRLRNQNKPVSEDRVSEKVSVTVTRRTRTIDRVFTGSVATLVAIIFINFGCALDWEVVKNTLRRPYGPLIGFCSQYVIMPLVSFGLAKLLFPENHAMQLGMFFTGVSPGGGASNIWTYLLGGNLNLSITMTTISTLAAFGMMPLWIFTLGRQIFSSAKLKVPYSRVSEVAAALIIPVFIGWLIQRYCPRVGKFMVRILKPFSALLIAFIVIFAIITNLYIFKLFTWKIVIAGLGLPWLGYLCGFLLALLLRQKHPDVLAISVETGVHNTGISIFMLRVALDQPEADLTTVVPVAVAIMTPIPLTIWYVVKTLRARWTNKEKMPLVFSDDERTAVNISEPLTIVSPNSIANNNRAKY